MRYAVRAVKVCSDGYIDTVDSDEQANFFGVYEIGSDGLSSWIADFLYRKDAEQFAMLKEG